MNRKPKITTRSRWRRRKQGFKAGRVETGPGIHEHIDTAFGRSFVEGGLAAAAYGDYGHVSNSEAAANQGTTAGGGGQIIAAFLFRDAIDAEKGLVVDITAASQRSSTTIIRLRDLDVAVAV